MFDTFVGAGATTRDYLLEPKHRKFPGCDGDSNFAAKITLFFLQNLAGQAPNPELATMESGDMIEQQSSIWQSRMLDLC